jgi:hypothetical protein
MSAFKCAMLLINDILPYQHYYILQATVHFVIISYIPLLMVLVARDMLVK